jgi:predicted transposase/invertase (TIGR01784 family)
MKREQNGQPEILSPLNDYVFSVLFGDQRHINILAAFLKSVLDIPEEDYASLTIVNPFLKRLFKSDKTGIVDVRVTTRSGRVIHVELQVHKIEHMPKRLLYYAAKLLVEQIRSGQDWGKLHQVISIVICNHTLFSEEPSYINTYELLNCRTNYRFTDLIRFIILELPKLPNKEDGRVWPWLKLFTCTRRAQYEELVREHPEVNMALGVLKEMSLIGRFRALAEAREIQRRDNAARMEYLRREGWETGLEEGRRTGLEEGHREGSRQKQLEIARNMKAEGFSAEQIARFTGLSPEDAETGL